MNHPPGIPTDEPVLFAGGIFVIQLRSDSDVARQCLHGRIEHVVSGGSERFESVAELLTFMARHTAAEGGDGMTSARDATEGNDHHGH